MTTSEAMDILRLDNTDDETTSIVAALVEAVPAYIETATGLKAEQQNGIPLCDTAAGFLIRLWYYPEGTDSERLQRAADNLLKSIALQARK